MISKLKREHLEVVRRHAGVSIRDVRQSDYCRNDVGIDEGHSQGNGGPCPNPAYRSENGVVGDTEGLSRWTALLILRVTHFSLVSAKCPGFEVV